MTLSPHGRPWDSVERHLAEGKGSRQHWAPHTLRPSTPQDTRAHVTASGPAGPRGHLPQRPGRAGGAAPEASPVSSEEVLDQRGHHLHPQLHLPTRLLEGGGRHRGRPQVELRLLLRKSADGQGGGQRGPARPSPWSTPEGSRDSKPKTGMSRSGQLGAQSQLVRQSQAALAQRRCPLRIMF